MSDFHAALSLIHHVLFGPVIGSLVRGSIPDHLDQGPLPAAELAGKAGMNELSLTRALRALAGFGAFQEVTPGVFANNSLSNLFRNQPGGLRNYAIFYSSDYLLQCARGLRQSVVTGESASIQVFGKSVWERFREHPDEGATFNLALAELRGNQHQEIADAYDWSAVDTIVDVGGGVGSLLASILNKRDGMRGVLVDQPLVLSDAERNLSERGVRDRCDLIGASFFDPIPAAGDIWILCQVLHDWADADCLSILKRCREAMRPGERLLVAEILTEPCRPNMQVASIDMVMLMFFGEARQRTVEEYCELFGATGFALSRVLPSAGAFSIVEARAV